MKLFTNTLAVTAMVLMVTPNVASAGSYDPAVMDPVVVPDTELTVWECGPFLFDNYNQYVSFLRGGHCAGASADGNDNGTKTKNPEDPKDPGPKCRMSAKNFVEVTYQVDGPSDNC